MAPIARRPVNESKRERLEVFNCGYLYGTRKKSFIEHGNYIFFIGMPLSGYWYSGSTRKKAPGGPRYWNKCTNVSSSVFDTYVLLLLACCPAFGAGCAFAKAVSERQTDPGAIGDTLKIQQQRIAFP